MKPLFAPALLVLWATLGEARAADVRVATTPWAPYADATVEGGGILVQLLTERLEAEGHNVSVDVLPWQRALMETEQGRYDVVFPLYRTEAREKVFRYTDPVANTALAVYGAAELELGALKPETLSGHRIGVVRGYSNGPLIDHSQGLTLDRADDDVSNLRKLLAGRVDLVVIDDLVARYTLATELGHLDGAELKGVLKEQTVYAAVSPQSDPSIVGAINRVFTEAYRDGTLEALSERYGLPRLVRPELDEPQAEESP